MSIATKAAGELLVIAGEKSAANLLPRELAAGAEALALNAERVMAGTSTNLLDIVGANVARVPAAPISTEAVELVGSRFPTTLARGTEQRFSLMVDGEKRFVDVHLPPLFNPAKKTPVFFLADGAQYKTVTGEMLDGYHWAATADRNGFAAVSLVQSPNSALPLTSKFLRMAPHNSTWRTAHGFINPSEVVNDVNYFDAVMKGVGGAMNVGSKNFVGFCDGGLFGHELARTYAFDGLATVSSTTFRGLSGPLATNRALFATVADDVIIPPAGGAGRSFGKFLLKMGHNNILASEPLIQGEVYAASRGLRQGAVTAGENFTQKTWLNATGEPGVVEMSLKSGGHNWPGTVYDHATLQVARQTSPETARLFNQTITDFLLHGKTPL